MCSKTHKKIISLIGTCYDAAAFYERFRFQYLETAPSNVQNTTTLASFAN